MSEEGKEEQAIIKNKKQMNKKLLWLSLAVVAVSLIYIFYGLNPETWQYALSKRIPKFIAFVLASGLIATATILFQTITNNRILTPSVLGLDALYILIQTLIVFVFTQIQVVLPNNTINFFISTALMLANSFVLYKMLFYKEQNIYFLLLVGTIMGTFFRSITGFLQMILDPNEFSLLQGKLFASFNNVQNHLLFAAIILVLLAIPFVYDYLLALDVMHLGKENALSLGIDYEQHTKRIFLLVALFTSVTTALIGPITFLGLIIANLSYEVAKTYKHTQLLLFGILFGILFIVGGQMIIERLFDFSIPLSVIINLFGGLYFIYLLVKERSA